MFLLSHRSESRIVRIHKIWSIVRLRIVFDTIFSFEIASCAQTKSRRHLSNLFCQLSLHRIFFFDKFFESNELCFFNIQHVMKSWKQISNSSIQMKSFSRRYLFLESVIRWFNARRLSFMNTTKANIKFEMFIKTFNSWIVHQFFDCRDSKMCLDWEFSVEHFRRRLNSRESRIVLIFMCWTRASHGWWGPAYHASRKHLMRMIRWCSSTIQILSAKRLDDESHSRFISSSDDQLRIELDLQAMTSNRDHYFDHYFDHHFDHHLRSERNQQTRRRDDWIDDVEAVWQRWNQIIVLEDELWLMTITLSRWIEHSE